MVRNVIGSVLALAGATAAVLSPFRAWYDGRHGSDYRIDDLFRGITDAETTVGTSILLPFAFAALVTLVGVMLRSRWLVALAGLVVLGFTVLWMVRQGQAAGSLTVGGDGPVLGDGVANALGGGVLLLLGSVVMSGRAPRLEPAEEPGPAYPSAGPEAYAPYEPYEPYGWAPRPGDTQPLPTNPPGPTDPTAPRRPRRDPYGAGPPQDPFRDDPFRDDPFGDGRRQR
ncbi:hypothetical protein [Streptomyces sp. NPDC059909]|uniref:hypothetical protein n=1 Tax=Streptomyces sp. NPDC059909 TaxID=3346998 RepID=UPI0036530873